MTQQFNPNEVQVPLTLRAIEVEVILQGLNELKTGQVGDLHLRVRNSQQAALQAAAAKFEADKTAPTTA